METNEFLNLNYAHLKHKKKKSLALLQRIPICVSMTWRSFPNKAGSKGNSPEYSQYFMPCFSHLPIPTFLKFFLIPYKLVQTLSLSYPSCFFLHLGCKFILHFLFRCEAPTLRSLASILPSLSPSFP